MSVIGAILASAGIGALGGLLGTGIQGAINFGLQKDSQNFNSVEAEKSRDFIANENLIARDFNASEAQKNRDFQQFMAQNGVQMKIDDMRAAGINPAIAGGFQGATASGGSQASVGPSTASVAHDSPNAVNNPGNFMLPFLKSVANNADLNQMLKDFTHEARKEQRAKDMQIAEYVNSVLTENEMKLDKTFERFHRYGYTDDEIKYYIQHAVFNDDMPEEHFQHYLRKKPRY